MFESFESFFRIFTSPIWILAALAFGLLWNLQRSFNKLEKMPRNHECQKCKKIIERHFPNTKFCLPCYEEIKKQQDAWIKELQECQNKAGDLQEKEAQRQNYQRAIELIDLMLALQAQFPKHGLRFSDNLPLVREAAVKELEGLG